MDKLVIEGGHSLRGEVRVGGAKNAALPILFATLLSDQEITLNNVPDMADIKTTIRLLSDLGVRAHYDSHNHSAVVCAEKLSSFQASYDLVRTMRASILVLGPMLARFGQAVVSLPGGCSIGARPVNLHLSALEQMGATIDLQEGYIHAKAKKLKGAEIIFEKVSVGATENTMMAACLAEGRTVLRNCAREPEIVDLARFLNAMGARIEGEGTDTIEIQGTSRLGGATYSILADRIEAGTYLIAAAITGGEVLLKNTPQEILGVLLEKLRAAGVLVEVRGPDISVSCGSGELRAVDVSTAPFPGFATDMQAQFMTLMTVAHGASQIIENIFENRFMHVAELARLGAEISVNGSTAVVLGKGPGSLKGATVMATDLRASASLVLAGLAAKGETTVRRIYHLDRGYERMEEKLRALGAKITREKE